MVHGGGHHHHHHGGGFGGGGGGHSHHHHHHNGGWFGRGRRYNNTNVVVVNNNNRGGWNTGSYQHGRVVPRGSYYPHSSENQDCEECCEACCAGACCASLCCTAASSRRQARGMSTWIVLSLFLFLILLTISNKDESRTLNEGESWKVSLPFLTEDLKIHSNIPNGANVYTSRHKCPPLTGPTVSLDNTIQFSLSPDDYQYDYYYLNAGSTVDMTVQESKGAVNVMLFRGKDTLESWEHDNDDDNRDSDAILKRYAGTNQMTKVHYTVPKSDFYVAVYDNASSGESHGTVSYHVDLTTYNLDGLSPIQNCQDNTGTCLIKTEEIECVIVQATASGNDVVTLSIKSGRRWDLLVFLSCIPLLIGYCRRKKQQRQQQEGLERPPAYAPVTATPAATMTMPSAPPEAQVIHEEEPPTAPPMAEAVAAVDYDSIPVPVENVITVLPPPNEDKV